MGSLELVRLSVESNGMVKLVALELRRRPADAAATELVVALFRARQAPPWLAALLLGSVRGPEGYAVAREILLSAPGLLAESYAGPAMARILGRSSRPDLVAILCGDWPKRTCEGAANGLAELHDPEVVDDVLRAVSSHWGPFAHGPRPGDLGTMSPFSTASRQFSGVSS